MQIPSVEAPTNWGYLLDAVINQEKERILPQLLERELEQETAPVRVPTPTHLRETFTKAFGEDGLHAVLEHLCADRSYGHFNGYLWNGQKIERYVDEKLQQDRWDLLAAMIRRRLESNKASVTGMNVKSMAQQMAKDFARDIFNETVYKEAEALGYSVE